VSDGRGLRFGTVAEQYDRYRPSPPPDAARILGDVAGKDVLEVAAGTGLWTRFLLQIGARVTVVEPDDEMRAVLERRSPQVRALRGSAEVLPVGDASFDAVLVSSAWHWFAQPAATNEIARVLRDEGTLYVLWNGFSRDVAWIAELAELRENPDDANRRPRGWAAEFPADGPFVDARNVSFDWTRSMSIDDTVALFGTFSGAIIQSEGDRRAMVEELRRRLAKHAHDGVVAIPMTLRGTIARRRAR
jgi:SAM-dependent methyltransferase